MTAPGASGATAGGATSAGAYAATGGQHSAPTADAHYGADVNGQVNGHADIGNASIGELISDVTRDLSTLMRQEVELAKAEIKTEVSKAGKGAGMLGGAGFAGYMVLLFLSFALWWSLENVMDAGWAALIVAGVWGVIGAVLFARGRSELRSVNPKPERTVETVKQAPNAFKTS